MPIDSTGVGDIALGAMPGIVQLSVAPIDGTADTMDIERAAFVLRKRAEHGIEGVYFPSLSARTIVYKGMLTSEQLHLSSPTCATRRFESGSVFAHSRFDEYVPQLAIGPSLPLSRTQRGDQYGGGKPQLDARREALLETSLIKGDLSRIYPVCTPGASDSASFDEVLELLHLGGRSLPHSVLMMIPEAWENHATMDEVRRAFYRYHAVLDGAVGRAGRRVLHRRHRGRSGPRPQRPAPRA